MAPAASYTNGFRFESGNLVKGLFFDATQSTKSKWDDDFATLEHASSLVYRTFVSISVLSLLYWKFKAISQSLKNLLGRILNLSRLFFIK